MADRSFAALRNDLNIVTDFPVCPVFDAALSAVGYVMIGGTKDDLAKLQTVRDALFGVWQGSIGEDAQSILFIMFAEPTEISNLRLARILPLSFAQGRVMASFERLCVSEGISVETPDISDLRHLDLWWGGKRHLFPLGVLSRLSLACLWDMPELHVHAPLREPAPAFSQRAATAPSKGEPRHAVIPIKGASDIAFGDAAQRDLALDERTRMRSIGTQLWNTLLRRKSVGNPDEAQQPDAPGVMANMAGWLLWHTPIGIPLARQFAERMKLVEKLMASGDVDSALRLALRLGSADPDQKAKNAYPTRLPNMRTALDFNIGTNRFAAPIMTGGNYQTLHAQYNELAARLEGDGDFKRAAYIRAQLQGNYHGAVSTLAKGELFLDAAKLAVEAKLPPALAIEMFYKAGERDTALALAKRADCFDQLAESSRKSDPEFHAYILRAWTDRLIETGQPLRALHVTDDLAKDVEINPALAEMRLSWIDMALDDSATSNLSPEVAVRALLSGEWADQNEILLCYAYQKPITDSSREAIALAKLLEWATLDEGQLGVVLDHLMRLQNPHSAEQASFWNVAAPIITERFILDLITNSKGALNQQQREGLQSLLRKAKAHVLATDLGKLKLQGQDRFLQRETWTLPSASVHMPTAVKGCFFANETLLVWRNSGLLQLMDLRGCVLWQGNMSIVAALIPIGSGSDALIVQAAEQGGYQLTRFSSQKCAFYPIGHANITAYHDITSDGQWLVQIGEQIGALDLSRLCASEPEFVFLWSVKLTASVQVISFLHNPHNPEWLTRDISDSRRNGLLEAWGLLNTTTLQTSLVRLQIEPHHSGIKRRYWRWTNRFSFLSAIKDGPTAQTSLWSEQSEREFCTFLEDPRTRDNDEISFQSVDQSRATLEWVANEHGQSTAVKCISHYDKKRCLTIAHGADMSLSCLARGASPGTIRSKGLDISNLILFGTDDGRLLWIDLASQKVTMM